MSVLFVITLLLMVGVAGTVLAGVFNMAKGGEGSAARSNRLMVWRVGLQGAALAALGLLFYLSKSPA